MGSSASVTTENPEPRRRPGSLSIRSRPAADDFDAAYSDKRLCQGRPRPSEAPPTGALTWVLGELTFYYGACCLYHRSAPPYREKMW